MPSSADLDLAYVLRAFREERGMSQEATAHSAGMSVATLVRLEAGRTNPTWTTVTQIAEALGLSLPTLAQAVEARRKHAG